MSLRLTPAAVFGGTEYQPARRYYGGPVMSAKATHSVSKSPSSLPCAGRIACSRCHQGGEVLFDQTRRTEGDWRITANPLAWGNPQAGALAGSYHDAIAYKGRRHNVGKILAFLGLIPDGGTTFLRESVDQLIADKNGRFHFGSLIRCTVERLEKGEWKGSGGGMLDRFVATPFGRDVASNCASRFLDELPQQTRLILMFGMGAGGSYILAARNLLQSRLRGAWRPINEVAYSNGQVTVVHVEHFAAQGALIPNWLSINDHPRARLGRLAREAVQQALA